MGLTEAFFDSWAIMFTWSGLMFFAIGMANGMFTGFIPGLSGAVGIALMIPLIGGIGPEKAIILFCAALAGQSFAGSISAILLNTPGATPNAATMLDGYPMTLQGKGGMALGISATASAMGGLIGTLIIVILLPFVRAIVLAFSFPELALLMLVGLSTVAVISKGAILKGYIAGLIGLGFSFIGFSPVHGELRLVFNNADLLNGVEVTSALVGLFAITEAIQLITAKRDRRSLVAEVIPFSQVMSGVKYVFTKPWLLIKSSSIGTMIGVVPAMGGTVAAFMAYFAARGSSKDPDSFGRGNPDGVLAPEASNDAKESGSALPSMAFGIPGSSEWAIVLGALILQGVTPGPMLIKEQPILMWLAVVTLALASIISSSIGLALSPLVTKVTKLRPSLLGVSIAALALAGTYSLNGKVVDLVWAVVFGVLGYFMSRSGYPSVPLILGLLLGKGFETNFNHTMSIMDGGLSSFVTRPISIFLLIACVLIVGSGFRKKKSKWVPKEEGEVSDDQSFRGITLEDKLFALFVVVFGGVLIVESVKLDQFAAKIFPLMVGCLLIAIVGAYLLIRRSPTLAVRFEGLAGNSRMILYRNEEKGFTVFGLNPEYVVLISFVAYLFGTVLVGPGIAMLLMGAFLQRWVVRDSWKRTLITLAVVYGTLWFGFIYLLDIKMGYGLLPL
jgi:putative tricarboxylic transport membrane protein